MVRVEPVDIGGRDACATKTCPIIKGSVSLENAGVDHQEQGSDQVQGKKSRGGLHG